MWVLWPNFPREGLFFLFQTLGGRDAKLGRCNQDSCHYPDQFLKRVHFLAFLRKAIKKGLFFSISTQCD